MITLPVVILIIINKNKINKDYTAQVVAKIYN